MSPRVKNSMTMNSSLHLPPNIQSVASNSKLAIMFLFVFSSLAFSMSSLQCRPQSSHGQMTALDSQLVSLSISRISSLKYPAYVHLFNLIDNSVQKLLYLSPKYKLKPKLLCLAFKFLIGQPSLSFQSYFPLISSMNHKPQSGIPTRCLPKCPVLSHFYDFDHDILSSQVFFPLLIKL